MRRREDTQGSVNGGAYGGGDEGVGAGRRDQTGGEKWEAL